MKTAHRKAAHGKRRYQADPAAMFRVFNRLEPFTQAEQHQLNVPVKLAYERLRTGVGCEDDFHTLAAAVNVAMIRAESIDPMAEQTAVNARDALLRCLVRHSTTGRWGFDGPALQDLPPAIDMHEQLVALSTPLQMETAQREARRRMEAGLVARVGV